MFVLARMQLRNHVDTQQVKGFKRLKHMCQTGGPRAECGLLFM